LDVVTDFCTQVGSVWELGRGFNNHIYAGKRDIPS
jgi:hypothetical protein